MVPSIALVRLTTPDDTKPLLVVGPSLGTSVTALWRRCAELLADRFTVVGWELPGHGHGPAATRPFTIAELAAGVLAAVDGIAPDGTFLYAGDSIGGAVGQQLAIDSGDRLTGLAAICTAARFGEPQGWHDRAATVRASGTPVMVEPSAKRWFAPGFIDREPEAAAALLHSLQDADAESYALVCEALAGFDVRARLGEISADVLIVGGAEDVATPPELQHEIARGIGNAPTIVLDDVGHLAPAEKPEGVAQLIGNRFAPPAGAAGDGRYDAGMAVRREVLGADHVDRANAKVTDVTRDFQQFITEYAWGGIWTRPGLARRDRSIAVLTALVAGRHYDELEFHLRAALGNGLTKEEIVEVLLQAAVYIGVPAANTAFAVANRVLGEEA